MQEKSMAMCLSPLPLPLPLPLPIPGNSIPGPHCSPGIKIFLAGSKEAAMENQEGNSPPKHGGKGEKQKKTGSGRGSGRGKRLERRGNGVRLGQPLRVLALDEGVPAMRDELGGYADGDLLGSPRPDVETDGSLHGFQSLPGHAVREQRAEDPRDLRPAPDESHEGR